MDDKWFKSVNARLREIEAEHAARYNMPLFHHETIRNSQYWHHSDWQATKEWFDWSANRFPNTYLRWLRTESIESMETIAGRPYRSDGDKIENQRTLMARIVALKLQYLLPEETT